MISITQNTDPELGRNDYQNLSLSAQASGYSKEKLTAYTSVRIIAVKPIEEDIYYRFPISASVSFIGMRNRVFMRTAFKGALWKKAV